MFEGIHKCGISSTGKLFGEDDNIDALHNQLIIFLLSTLTWRCRLAHKVVWRGHQLHVRSIFGKIRRSWLNTLRWGRPMSSITVLLANVAARAFKQPLVRPTAVTLMCPVVSLFHYSQIRRVCWVFLQKLRRMSRCERYGKCWLVSPTFRPVNSKLISRNFECNVSLIGAAVFTLMFVLSALVILASTCRRELFRSKYKSFAHLTETSLVIFGWIVTSGAYSRLNSFSMTFCWIIYLNQSTSLVICYVTSPPIIGILKL